MFRIAFDPELPVVATSAFPDGTCQAGEVFDWRAKGLQPIDALAMFRSGLLAHLPPPPPPPPQAAPAVPSQATVQSLGTAGGAQVDALTDAELERLTAPAATDADPPPATDKRRGRSR